MHRLDSGTAGTSPPASRRLHRAFPSPGLVTPPATTPGGSRCRLHAQHPGCLHRFRTCVRIDSHAHQGALAGCRESVAPSVPASVAVAAGGLDKDYPSGNRDLVEAIRAKGLVVSEQPPGSAPTRKRFAARNRIVAALSAVTVVVEARSWSSALDIAERVEAGT
ncbi:DNA-processing protein DprA [Paenarthrobacter sp. CCNWLW172]